jgi:hypothetical protein
MKRRGYELIEGLIAEGGHKIFRLTAQMKRAKRDKGAGNNARRKPKGQRRGK